MRQERHLVARKVTVLTPAEQPGCVPDLLLYSIQYHRLSVTEYLASNLLAKLGGKKVNV